MHVTTLQSELVSFTRALVEHESPTDVPASQRGVQDLIADALESLDVAVERLPGQQTGGQLYGRARWGGGPGAQLLVGHSDTVWPLGTLASMPVELDRGVLRGPGVFDMKAGLAQLVFALRTLVELGLEPPAVPVVLVNSDEEMGSFESRPLVHRLARAAARTYVLEPSYGPEGYLKTARKGVGQFRVTIRGRSAHAGLEPETGASAILELANVIHALHALNDRERGITVNVGVVDGGVRPNVVAPVSRAQVDVRVLASADARMVTERILALSARTPGVSLEIEGTVDTPPLERTPRNRRLFDEARRAGAELGLELGEATVGGASDGNVTSLHSATLDGLGAVGGGAHASHEHVRVEGVVARCALLARLLLIPVEERPD
ncbi:MAG: M20/M25/M40 family metallo-hydrolase [Gemmatimonadota bacterium]|nr:M20/M25/M40 family metallo-hydrolase [Gemmatimonadota bacterium]